MLSNISINESQLIDLENDGTFFYISLSDNDSYLIGRNTSDRTSGRGNAFVESALVPETLVIPDTFNQKPVTEIGQYAFAKCFHFTKIIIGNNIKIIHSMAFADVNNTQMVFIPSSVEYIFNNGIYFWSEQLWNGNHTTKGKVQIIFQENSKLKFIQTVFSYKETLEIISPSIINSECIGVLGEGSHNIRLFSTHSFSLCNLNFKGCITINSNIYLHLHSFLVCYCFILLK